MIREGVALYSATLGFVPTPLSDFQLGLLIGLAVAIVAGIVQWLIRKGEK